MKGQRKFFIGLPIILFSLFILSSNLVLSDVIEPSPIEKPIINYTPGTRTECVNGKCTLTLYSGVRYIEEDTIWKPIEEARSLMDVWTPTYISIDKDLHLRVDDVNYTSITLCANVEDTNLDKQIPIKRCETVFNKSAISIDFNESSQDLDNAYYINCTETNILFTSKDEQCYTIQTKSIPLAYNYTFGEHSTTIILQDADTENLDDAHAWETNPDTNYGSEDDLRIGFEDATHKYWSYIEFDNPLNGEEVTNASLNMYHRGGDTSCDVGDDNDLQAFSIWNQSWSEDVITWNNKPDEYGSALDTQSFIPQSYVGWIRWEATTFINQSVAGNNESFTFLVFPIATQDVDCHSKFNSKEYSTAAQRPFLNITYSETGDSVFPSVSIQLPSNTTYYDNNISINYTASDETALDQCWYSFDNGDTNTSLPNCDNITVSKADGSHLLWVYANDSSGNINNTESVGFTVQILANVTINLNTTTPESGESVSVSGLAYLSDGTNVTDNRIGIFIDGIELYPTYGCSSDWWNCNWYYRKPINISNTYQNFTNYAINITLNATPLYEAGKLQVDCDDIRITWLNGTEQLIDHWEENCTTGDNGTLSVFWAEVPFIENNTNATIYIYYGNSTVSSVSNLGNTLYSGTFTDDFDDTTKINATDSFNYSVFNGVVGIPTEYGTVNYQVVSNSEDMTYWTLNLPPQCNLNDARILAGDGTLGFYEHSGMRFQNVSIPQGADITNAYMGFRASASLTDDTVKTKFYAEEYDSCAVYSTCADFIGRDLSEASTDWDFTTNWASGTWYYSSSVNFAASVEEVTDRAGWVGGTSELCIQWKNDGSSTGAYRQAYSHDGSSADAPKIWITYEYSNYTTANVSSIIIPSTGRKFIKGNQFTFTDAEPTSTDIKYHIQYWNGSTWVFIDEAYLAGNADGFDTSGINLTNITYENYTQIRIISNHSASQQDPAGNITTYSLSYYYRNATEDLIPEVFNEQYMTRTDANGNYNYTFTSPTNVQTYTIKVNYTDASSNFGENQTTFSVLRGEYPWAHTDWAYRVLFETGDVHEGANLVTLKFNGSIIDDKFEISSGGDGRIWDTDYDYQLYYGVGNMTTLNTDETNWTFEIHSDDIQENETLAMYFGNNLVSPYKNTINRTVNDVLFGAEFEEGSGNPYNMYASSSGAEINNDGATWNCTDDRIGSCSLDFERSETDELATITEPEWYLDGSYPDIGFKADIKIEACPQVGGHLSIFDSMYKWFFVNNETCQVCYLKYYGSGSYDIVCDSAHTLSAGQWYEVGVHQTSTTSATFYVDGEAGDTDVMNSGDYWLSAYRNYEIGVRIGAHYFDGKIGRVYVKKTPEASWFNTSKVNWTISNADMNAYDEIVIPKWSLNSSFTDPVDADNITFSVYLEEQGGSNLSSCELHFSNQTHWYDFDWEYRREITIDNTGGTVLNNYTDYITIDFSEICESGKTEEGAWDLRVVDTNRDLVDYWYDTNEVLEIWTKRNLGWDCSDTSDALQVWFKTNVPADNSKTLYLMYGNKKVVGYSDFENTFDKHIFDTDDNTVLLLHMDYQDQFPIFVSKPVEANRWSNPFFNPDDGLRYMILSSGYRARGIGGLLTGQFNESYWPVPLTIQLAAPKPDTGITNNANNEIKYYQGRTIIEYNPVIGSSQADGDTCVAEMGAVQNITLTSGKQAFIGFSAPCGVANELSTARQDENLNQMWYYDYAYTPLYIINATGEFVETAFIVANDPYTANYNYEMFSMYGEQIMRHADDYLLGTYDEKDYLVYDTAGTLIAEGNSIVRFPVAGNNYKMYVQNEGEADSWIEYASATDLDVALWSDEGDLTFARSAWVAADWGCPNAYYNDTEVFLLFYGGEFAKSGDQAVTAGDHLCCNEPIGVAKSTDGETFTELNNYGEDSATVLQDSSGNGNGATKTAGTWKPWDLRYGYGRWANDTCAREVVKGFIIDKPNINVSDSDSLDLTTNFTMMIDIGINETGDTILFKNMSYEWRFSSGTRKQELVLWNATSSQTFTSTTALSVDNDDYGDSWFCDNEYGHTYTLAVVYNTTHVTFYIDGEEDLSVESNITSVNVTANDLYIGYRQDGSNDLIGRIDELVILNESLSPQEVYNRSYRRNTYFGNEPTITLGSEEQATYSIYTQELTDNESWCNISINPGAGDYGWFFNFTDTSGNSHTSDMWTLVDTSPPTYSNNQTNDTIAGAEIMHSVLVSDNTGIDTCDLWFDNGTGTFAKVVTADDMGSTTSKWFNTSLLVNDTVGATIQWRPNCTDINGYYNDTVTYSYVTTIGVLSYSGNLSQAVSVSEEQEKQTGILRSISDFFNTLDVISLIKSLARQITAAITFDESMEKGLDTGRSDTEPIGITEDMSRQFEGTRSADEPVSIDESEDIILGMLRALNDYFNIDQLVDTLLSLLRGSDQAINVADDASRQADATRSLSDPISFAENVFGDSINSYAKSIVEAITLDDSLRKGWAAGRSESEPMGIVEDKSRQTDVSRSTNIFISIGENVFGDSWNSYARSVVDAITMMDSLTKGWVAQRSEGEPVGIGEDKSRQADASRSVNLPVTIVEELFGDSINSYAAAVVQAITMDESIGKQYAGIREGSDSISLNEDMSKQTGILRSITQLFSIGENVFGDSINSYAASIVEAITLEDVLGKQYIGQRSDSDPVGIGEADTRRYDGSRSADDALSIGDSTDKSRGILKSITDALQISEGLSSFKNVFRSVVQSIIISMDIESTTSGVPPTITHFNYTNRELTWIEVGWTIANGVAPFSYNVTIINNQTGETWESVNITDLKYKFGDLNDNTNYTIILNVTDSIGQSDVESITVKTEASLVGWEIGVPLGIMAVAFILIYIAVNLTPRREGMQALFWLGGMFVVYGAIDILAKIAGSNGESDIAAVLNTVNGGYIWIIVLVVFYLLFSFLIEQMRRMGKIKW